MEGTTASTARVRREVAGGGGRGPLHLLVAVVDREAAIRAAAQLIHPLGHEDRRRGRGNDHVQLPRLGWVGARGGVSPPLRGPPGAPGGRPRGPFAPPAVGPPEVVGRARPDPPP